MTSKSKVTISDIADRADVSISTVSRVLRGTTPVTQPKREAVLAAVAELNYEPNLFARGLASGQSMAIGVLTQNFGSPFYDAILQGVVRGLDESGYFPIFADGQWQPETEKEAVQTFLQRKIDGLVIIGGTLDASQLIAYNEQIPTVAVARRIPDFAENNLYVDNVTASYEATKHLIGLGHRRIAHITGRADHPDSSDRIEGYRKALDEAGIALIPQLIVEGNFRRQSGVLAVDMLFARGVSFSAIFAANDQMAYGTRLALFRRGIRVPEDLSLVGFDDEPAAAFMIPPLTTVRQPGMELGGQAAALVLARLKDESIELPELPATLIVRESTSIQRY